MRDEHPLNLEVRLFPFRKGCAAEATITIPAPKSEVWKALEELERLPEIVPLLEEARKAIREDGLWECFLEGRIGIWKLGYPLTIHYVMKVIPEESMELVEYLGGVFPDVYFRHELTPRNDRETQLKSIYYFDLEGFTPLKILRFAQRSPWIREIVNLSAAALMVRGFSERWLAPPAPPRGRGEKKRAQGH